MQLMYDHLIDLKAYDIFDMIMRGEFTALVKSHVDDASGWWEGRHVLCANIPETNKRIIDFAVKVIDFLTRPMLLIVK